MSNKMPDSDDLFKKQLIEVLNDINGELDYLNNGPVFNLKKKIQLLEEIIYE